MNLIRSLELSGALVTVMFSAGTIVRRDDTADERYLALGAQFPAVVALGRRGDATLIDARWLLTAAHVARSTPVGSTVMLGGTAHTVDRVVLHPQWRELGEHDMGLLRLREPVGNVTPLRLYRASVEQGIVATLVGHGDAGTGASRVRVPDGRLRAATSRVDSASSAWLYFSFDAPPHGTALEGAPGPGDSGGPAILTMNGEPLVAGVSSAGFDGRDGPGTYGAVDAFTRVSTHAAWIDSVMAGSPSATTGSGSASRASADTTLPDTPAGRRYAAFLRAMRSGADSAIERFVRENFDEREVAGRPALIPNMKRLSGMLKRAPIDAIVRSEPLSLVVRLRGAAQPITIELLCAPNEPYKLVDWRRLD
jgi:hypothetical protein